MIKLNIGQAKPDPAPAAKDPAPKTPENNADLLYRRIIQFTHPQTGEVFLGTPLEFMPNYTHHSIQPGSRNLLGEPGIWALEMDALPGRLIWVDDPVNGVFSREISDIKQVLGCKGKIDGIEYSFDTILQVGQNTVAYQLTNLATCAQSVIGLGRDDFDPVAGLRNYHGKSHQGPCPIRPCQSTGPVRSRLKILPAG